MEKHLAVTWTSCNHVGTSDLCLETRSVSFVGMFSHLFLFFRILLIVLRSTPNLAAISSCLAEGKS